MRKFGVSCLLLMFLVTTAFGGTALGNGGGGQVAGTSIQAWVEAVGFWVKKTSYDWTIEKSADVERPVIKPGDSYPITYTLKATRSAPLVSNLYDAKGFVTVKADRCDAYNPDGSCKGVDKTTQGLKIIVEIEYKGTGNSWTKIAQTEIVPEEQLKPGETKLYPYEVPFTPVQGAKAYRVNTKVIITNHSGSLGQEWSTSPKDTFFLPLLPIPVIEDATASLKDVYQCPLGGFSCSVDNPGPWNLTDSNVITYIMTVVNESAPMKRFYSLLNTATLTEKTTKETRTADEKVNIYTGCPCQ